MKKLVIAATFAVVLLSCQDKKENEVSEVVVQNESPYTVFGEVITPDGAISKEEMLEKFKTLKEGDTIEAKFASTIAEVCQKKGCWMKVDLGSEEAAFTNFDYKFLMPLNSANSDAIINGKAFLEVTSVEDLQHYAKDAGKSQEAIDSIIEPKVRYSFLADGVLIAK